MNRTVMYWTAGAIFLILAAGTLTTWFTADKADQGIRQELLRQTSVISHSINPALIKALEGTENDRQRPEYHELQNQLLRLERYYVSEIYEYMDLYLFGRTDDNQVFFYVDTPFAEYDDEQAPMPLPGEIYDDASFELRNAFDSGKGFIEGPLPDQWGVWVSALVPVHDPETGRVLSILGMDIEAAHWKSDVLRAASIPALSSAFLAIIALSAGWIINRRLILQQKIVSQTRELRTSHDRFEQLAKQSRTVSWEVDPGGMFTHVNESSEHVFGYRPDEIVNKYHFYDLHPQQGREEFKKSMLEIIEDKKTIQDIENRIQTKSGQIIWVLTNGLPVLDDSGNLIAYQGMDKDITERKQVEQALKEARIQAEDASRAKSEFLANMSHEIRTPINGIMGVLQLLQTTSLSQEQKKFSDLAVTSAGRLNRLLSDILDLSKIEAGMLDIRQEILNLKELSDSVTGVLSITAMDKGISLKAHVDPALPCRLFGDEVRLRQILFNLVGNALKYTNAGSVTLEISPLSSQGQGVQRVLFSVEDTGIGISQDQINGIFEPFRQVDGTYTRKYQGAGLGLSIVRRLVKLMEGDISIESTPGRGTRIHVALPFKIAVSRQEENERPVPVDIRQPRKLKILLVEDEPTNQIVVCRMLEKMGHEVTLAVNGQEALNLYARQDFDGILMDIQMPVLDGVEATKRIRLIEGEKLGAPENENNRSIPDTHSQASGLPGETPSRFFSQRQEAHLDFSPQPLKRVPIIALTAHSMLGDKEKFLAAGMDGYLAKPLKMEDLERIFIEIFMKKF